MRNRTARFGEVDFPVASAAGHKMGRVLPPHRMLLAHPLDLPFDLGPSLTLPTACSQTGAEQSPAPTPWLIRRGWEKELARQPRRDESPDPSEPFRSPAPLPLGCRCRASTSQRFALDQNARSR